MLDVVVIGDQLTSLEALFYIVTSAHVYLSRSAHYYWKIILCKKYK